jgi:hypothetical protein
MCLCALSCKVPSAPFPSLVVLDVDGFPPGEGFVLLVEPSDLGSNPTPLGAQLLDDTLFWDGESGTVLPTCRVPSQAQWAVFSPDPMPPHSWRHVRLDATGQDTCRLTSDLPVELNLRLSRSLGSTVEAYSLCFSDALSHEPDTLPLEGTRGSHRFSGSLPIQHFPIRVSLLRHHVGVAPHVVASHMQETVPHEFPLRLNWSDLDETDAP